MAIAISPPEFVKLVLGGSKTADASMLVFRDLATFVAGNLHKHIEAREGIAALAPMNWIRNTINVYDFFQPFKGHYKGENFNFALPPPKVFCNSASCKPFAQFISETIMNRLATGAISLWGKVGEVTPRI